MSRYIDADVLKEKIDSMWNGRPLSSLGARILVTIDEAPSIDIVRCKECRWIRYCETEDLDLYLDCDKSDGGGIPRSEEWFCADGERKESE